MARRISPTKLSIGWFRKRGVPCCVVERDIRAPNLHGGSFKRDCFGGDLIALTKQDTIMVQAGAACHHMTKVAKAISLPEVAQWLDGASRKFWVMTWQKRLVGKSGRWVPRVSLIQRGAKGLVEVSFETS